MRLPEPLRGSSTSPSKIDCIAKLSIPCCPFGLARGKKGGGYRRGQATRRRSLASRRCGWRPLRLIRYKPSQLMFHHPTVQTRRALSSASV